MSIFFFYQFWRHCSLRICSSWQYCEFFYCNSLICLRNVLRKDWNCGTTAFLAVASQQCVCSYDIPSCHFALFPKMKLKLKGCHVNTINEIWTELEAILDSLQEKISIVLFESWKRHWDHCIYSQVVFQRGWWLNLNKVNLYLFFFTVLALHEVKTMMWIKTNSPNKKCFDEIKGAHTSKVLRWMKYLFMIQKIHTAAEVQKWQFYSRKKWNVLKLDFLEFTSTQQSAYTWIVGYFFKCGYYSVPYVHLNMHKVTWVVICWCWKISNQTLFSVSFAVYVL